MYKCLRRNRASKKTGFPAPLVPLCVRARPEQSVEMSVTDYELQGLGQSAKNAFRAVQAAEQERDRLEKQADAYANRVLAQARGESAQVFEEAEGYRARVVNEATGEASRFSAVLEEYQKAPEVTRKRLYIETMEKVLADVDKTILDSAIIGEGGSGVVPYLPLNELRRTTGGN